LLQFSRTPFPSSSDPLPAANPAAASRCYSTTITRSRRREVSWKRCHTQKPSHIDSYRAQSLWAQPCSVASMADVCGSSAGDGGDENRRPSKEKRDSWNCRMIDKDGRTFEKVLKTRRWGVVGRDGSRVLLELDEYGVPIGEEGCFLRQVNGKIVKNRKFDIGAKNLHKVTK
ncbi:hypothetical protein LINGRAHAP2_LOCUS22772, partial [Linum grandiflorum]